MSNEILKVENNTMLNEIFETKEVSKENSEIRHSTTTDNAKLFNALRGKSISIRDVIGETFDIIDIVITANDVLKDKDDESLGKENKPIVHFYTKDGQHLSSLSNGIIRNTKALLETGIIPTEESPIKIKFDEVKTKKGTAFTFELV